jgi:O-antigen ligase
MAETNGTRNGDSPITLAERLGTDSEWAPARSEAPTIPDEAFPLRVAGEPVRSGTEPPAVPDTRDTAPPNPGSVARLQAAVAAAEARARRLAADVELVQSDVRRQVELALIHAQHYPATRSSRWQATAAGRPGRFAWLSPRDEEARGAPGEAVSLRRTRLLVVLGLVLVVAAVASAAGGLLWTARLENFVLDSGFEGAPMRWRPAGLRTEVARAPGLGRMGSTALRVRTEGAGDGEGPGYFEIPSIVPGKPFTFSVFAKGIQDVPASAAVYPEIRWRASNGSLLQATRGRPTTLDGSWKRLVVSGVAPDSTTSALLVVGEAAGTPAPVSFLLDDAQLQRATTPGPYVETGEQTAGRPSHPTDLAALLMLAAAGLLAYATLSGAVLVALPLSLAIPPSFANLGSHVPDFTPTRALVIACFAAAVARGQLRAPPRWMVALGVLYSTIVFAVFVRDPSFVSMRLALSLTIGAFAPALLVIAVARVRRDISILAISLAATGAVVAVVALAEWYFNRHWIPLFPGVIFDALERADHLRARATFPHPIVLGTFLAMALQLTLSLLLNARGSRRILAGVGFLVVACGLAVTLSRAPWLAAIVGFAVVASLSGVWRRWKVILALAVALLALVASPIGAPMRDAAASLVRPKSEQDRFVLQMRIDATKRIGSSGVRNLVGASLDPAARPAFPAVIEGREIDLGDSIDNTYVRELSQSGLLGLLALVALLIAVVIETRKGARSEDAEARFLASGLVAAQVVVLVVGLTVGTIAFSQVGTAFWLVAGAGIATTRLCRHTEPL